MEAVPLFLLPTLFLGVVIKFSSPAEAISTVGDLSACMINNLDRCRMKCYPQVPADSSEAVDSCFGDSFKRMFTIQRCVNAAGISANSNCFTVAIDSKPGSGKPGGVSTHRSRFSPMKAYPYFHCLKLCSDSYEKCDENCPAAEVTTQSILRDCYEEANEISDGDLFQCLLKATGNV